jgi:hypothetical protein
MSPEDLLLVAHRNERFAMFWKYAEEDEDDAPLASDASADRRTEPGTGDTRGGG